MKASSVRDIHCVEERRFAPSDGGMPTVVGGFPQLEGVPPLASNQVYFTEVSTPVSRGVDVSGTMEPNPRKVVSKRCPIAV